MRIGWPGFTSSGPWTRCWSREVPFVEPRSSTYHWPPRLVRRACRELAKSSVRTSVESSARPIRIGWSPRLILVPLSGPAVTTRVRRPLWPRFFPAAARGGTDATRPARPPKRSARTTRKAAKMNSHNSNRKPKRKTCRTISAVTRPSRAVLPVDQHRVADPDDVAVRQHLPADPPAVDERSVGGAEVLDGRLSALEDHVDVLAAHPGVGQPDVGLGAATDDVAPGGQLVAGAGTVDDQPVGHPRAGAGPADDRRVLAAGVGGHPPADRRQGRERGAAVQRRSAQGLVEPAVVAERRAGGVVDLRADLEDAGRQVAVALEPDGDLVEDLVALAVDVLGHHVGELAGQLVRPLAEVLVVGLAEAAEVDIGCEHAAFAQDGSLLVGLALEGLGDLGRMHLPLEDAGERQAHHALESSLEALQHTHSRSLALVDVPLSTRDRSRVPHPGPARNPRRPARPRCATGNDPPPAPGNGGRLLMSSIARASGGMADAHGSGPCVRKDVGVQLPPCPPNPEGFPTSSGRCDRHPHERAGSHSPRPPTACNHPLGGPPRQLLPIPRIPGPTSPCLPDWTPPAAPPPCSPGSARPTRAPTPSPRSARAPATASRAAANAWPPSCTSPTAPAARPATVPTGAARSRRSTRRTGSASARSSARSAGTPAPSSSPSGRMVTSSSGPPPTARTAPRCR